MPRLEARGRSLEETPARSRGDEDDDEEVTRLCASWLLRALALGCFLGGTHGAHVFGLADAAECPRAPRIVAFWDGLRHLGGTWLVYDVFACFFCLRCGWLAQRVGRFFRFFSYAGWSCTVYGLSQYSMQLGQRKCWGPGSAAVMLALLAIDVLVPLWWIIIDCDHFCSTLGEAGHGAGACGCGWLALREWPAGDLPDLDLEAATPSVSRPPRPPRPSDDGPRPAVLGRAHRQQRSAAKADGGIKVMRAGEVLHAGQTHRGVKRWVERNLPDRRGVTVVDTRPPRRCPAHRHEPVPAVASQPQRLASPSSPPDSPTSSE